MFVTGVLCTVCGAQVYLTIFIRFNTEMQDNRRIVDAIYMYILKFIKRAVAE